VTTCGSKLSCNSTELLNLKAAGKNCRFSVLHENLHEYCTGAATIATHSSTAAYSVCGLLIPG